MSGYLDAYDPNLSITPAVIFVNRDKVRVLLIEVA